jgi:hypothetical protein
MGLLTKGLERSRPSGGMAPADPCRVGLAAGRSALVGEARLGADGDAVEVLA